MSSGFLRSWWAGFLVFPIMLVAVAVTQALTHSTVLAIAVVAVFLVVRVKLFPRRRRSPQ